MISPSLAQQDRRESTLLWFAFAFVLGCAAALTVAPSARIGIWSLGLVVSASGLWAFFIAWSVCALVSAAVLRRALPRHDPFLLPLALLPSGWGLALIWRLTPAFGLRQSLWLVVATAAMLGVVLLPGDLRWLRRYKYTWLLGGLVLTALTLVLGVNPSGAGQRLWLGCCGVYLQPAEVLKLLLVVFLAAYLADRRESLFGAEAASTRSSLAYFVPMLLMWGFSLVLLMSQRDLGMSSLFFAAFVVMLYLASGRAVFVVVGLALLVAGGAVGYRLFDVVRLRVDTWWNPWLDPSGSSYQIVQSLIAVAAGGVMGRGPGLGAPTLIPVAHSDFIFAALAEEWGLAGLLAVVALVAALTFRGFHVALRARGPFRQLLAAGLAAMLGVQSLLIMGGVIKLVPLTGVTLPFMSYGGSSLVTSFITLGLLLRLSSSDTRTHLRT